MSLDLNPAPVRAANLKQRNLTSMTPRQIRRAAEHAARKAARKAGFPIPTAVAQPTNTNITTLAAVAAASPISSQPESEFFLSPARLVANRANAKLSTGAKSPETHAICAQNHTVHGLARHQNGTFKLLGNEDSANFEALKQSLADEYLPQTPTETILVNGMAESHWLAARAQRLQDTCLNPETGDVTDEKKFTLYMRYQTTHTRAFHKCLNDLLKLRAEKRKAELGFEAHKRKENDQRLKNELHEISKKTRAAETRYQIAVTADKILSSHQNNPGFEAQYEVELAKHNFTQGA
jgi:hypothetical protein